MRVQPIAWADLTIQPTAQDDLMIEPTALADLMETAILSTLTPSNVKQAIKPLQGLALSANQPQATSSVLDSAWKVNQAHSINLLCFSHDFSHDFATLHFARFFDQIFKLQLQCIATTFHRGSLFTLIRKSHF